MSGLAQNFHFLRPWWLVGLLAVPALWWLGHRARSSRTWARVCDAHLLPHLLVGAGRGRTRRHLWLATMIAVITLTALAGPVWEQRPQPLYRGGDAQVIVLDLSRSMLAADVKPTRLERAKFKISDLLNDMNEGQVGLVVFAGDAFVVSPLTDDANTVQAMLDALTPDIMPSQGGKASRGLAVAQELLVQAGVAEGRVLLVADEADTAAREQAQTLATAGYQLSVLAVGTRSGAPIPLADGGFVEAPNGDIVVPRLDLVALRDVASMGGGRAVRLRADNADLEQLAAAPEWGPEMRGRETSLSAEAWREEGPWLVLLLLPLAALTFRRGWMAILALAWLAPVDPTVAGVWADLWQRPDQQAQRALDGDRPGEAAALARDPGLKGSAHYRADDYVAAAQNFTQWTTADGHYNRGNALARLGRYGEAIAAYEQALQLDPNMEDAAYNKSLLEQQQQQQEQEQQQNQDGDQGSEDDQSEQSDEAGEPTGEEEETDGEGDADEQDASEQEPSEQDSSAENDGEAADESEQRQADTADPLSEEERQAVEQWLRRIPDDPGGLLRRKFLLQYRQRGGAGDEEQAW